jgi:hypothetical protein
MHILKDASSVASVESTLSQSSASQTTVQNSIDDGRPVFIRVNSGGHFIVLYGLDGDTLYYMDPWPGEGKKYQTFSSGAVNGRSWTHTLELTTQPDTDPEPDPDPDEISNGETVTDLSASQSHWLRFYIDVPENATNLTVRISGGDGDADLYTRYNAEPTTSEHDCRPYLDGNSESCTEERPRDGRWYIGLNGWRDFSGVILTAGYDGDDGNPDPEPDPEPGPDPEPSGQCVTATNATHISQVRAYRCGIFNWLACAVGSGDYLGLSIPFFSMTASVQEMAPNYWERVWRCP